MSRRKTLPETRTNNNIIIVLPVIESKLNVEFSKVRQENYLILKMNNTKRYLFNFFPNYKETSFFLLCFKNHVVKVASILVNALRCRVFKFLSTLTSISTGMLSIAA